MQRVWNEMTADRRHGALGGRGGVKMGDFGVGGRVYVSKVNLKKIKPFIKMGLCIFSFSLCIFLCLFVAIYFVLTDVQFD